MPQDSEIGPRRLLVLTDGRPANLGQAAGLAQAIARLVPASVATAAVRLRPGLGALPNRVLLPLPAALAGLPGGRHDLAIGAGRRGNLAAARLRGQGAARAVAILDPELPADRFDAIILPEHDGRTGSGFLTTLGAMHPLTREGIAAAAAAAPLPDLPAPRLAILAGGPSRSARFGRAEAQRLIADLAGFAGWSLIATLSRRSPPWLGPMLAAALPRLWLWDGRGPNPYPGLLGRAEAVLVTEDSVSMASEAAATGLPLFVSGLGRVAPKLARFHAGLRARGIARPAAAGPARWTYAPLDEAGRMAAALVARFGFS
jgi:hypothetical protein